MAKMWHFTGMFRNNNEWAQAIDPAQMAKKGISLTIRREFWTNDVSTDADHVFTRVHLSLSVGADADATRQERADE